MGSVSSRRGEEDDMSVTIEEKLEQVTAERDSVTRVAVEALDLLTDEQQGELQARLEKLDRDRGL
jgi:hypothetical protein